MKSRVTLGIVRILIGLLGIAAIATQLVQSISLGRDMVNFFSFFTIESNVVAAILYLCIGIYMLASDKPRFIGKLRGALTLYMTITGIVYILLLTGVSVQITVPWVNIVLHYLLPAIILLDWLVFPPKEYISPKYIPAWLIYPIVYLFYSLVRGGFTSWYPYPFINPILNGWPTVIVTSIFIGIGAAVLSLILTLRTLPNKPKVAM